MQIQSEDIGAFELPISYPLTAWGGNHPTHLRRLSSFSENTDGRGGANKSVAEHLLAVGH